jgi:hypothetical protein
MDSKEITELEMAHALNRLAKRLMDIGWMDQFSIEKGGVFRIGYTELGRGKMSTLREVLTEEMRAALSYTEFRALIALLNSLDRSLPPLSPPPES